MQNSVEATTFVFRLRQNQGLIAIGTFNGSEYKEMIVQNYPINSFEPEGVPKIFKTARIPILSNSIRKHFWLTNYPECLYKEIRHNPPE